ncbi:hypothetical protein P171DRAFT_91045 [Karstenula rhodostoma CBS 690.94]|uniref:TFIIF beta subunit HTH domain-containing protein n=1 Tax=Karstenula rhodostoma CBS 690.94 TaxID=1392251 RepID=A0A9P4PC15_9PLEO|nr:hypothetical protein P171DRAFT_91045 [Karstenula rhodostoma CBS 690.94]
MADQSTATLGLGNSYSAANLLAHGLKRAFCVNMMQLPSTQELRKERLDALLNTPTGRDFTINTAVGVVFKVHSIMLIGGPKALEQVAFPKDNAPGDNTVNLPGRFEPLFVDRLVAFIYTSTYPVDSQTIKITTLQHHTVLPPGATPDSFALAMDATEFQVCMYGLAEVLEYTALISFAYGKLASYFVFDRKAPHKVSHLIKLLFAPVGGPGRKCKDEVGALKSLGIAAVLVHEKKHWSGHEMDEFRDLLANELEQGSWKEYRACYKQIKDANRDLLVDPTSAYAHHYGTRPVAQNIGSLVSSMSNVALAGGSKPNLLEELHLLFDEYAYWSLKVLKAKTGRSGQALNEALPKIAHQVQTHPFHGFWQRKAHFNRPSLYQCTEQMGQTKPLPLSQSHPQLVFPSRNQQMGIGHQPAPTASASHPTNDIREGTPLAKRKFANPSRTVVTTPSGMKIVDTAGDNNAMDHDAADATGMLDSKHAPKVAKLGVKGIANATFDFAGRTMAFDSAPAAPQAGTISLEGLKKLQQVGVANGQAKKTVKVAEKAEKGGQKGKAKAKAKEEGMDVDWNKENIPVDSDYAAPQVEEEMVD